MSIQEQSQYPNQHQQRNDHRQKYDRQRAATLQEHRREFLWRERVKLEMQVHALLALLQGIEQEWSGLEQSRAILEQEKQRVAVQVVLSSLAGSRYLPAERLFQYRRERLV